MSDCEEAFEFLGRRMEFLRAGIGGEKGVSRRGALESIYVVMGKGKGSSPAASCTGGLVPGPLASEAIDAATSASASPESATGLWSRAMRTVFGEPAGHCGHTAFLGSECTAFPDCEPGF